MMALAIAFVGELLPKAKTGSAMGLLGTTSAIGTALGPSLGGVLITQIGWRAIFLVNLPLGLVALFLVHRALPADPPASRNQRAGVDVAGTASLALTLAAYALAMTVGRGHVGVLNLASLGAAAFGAASSSSRRGERPTRSSDSACSAIRSSPRAWRRACSSPPC